MSEIIEHDGYRIEILPDDDAGNPFMEWDGMDHLLTWHRNQTFSNDRFEDFGMCWTPDGAYEVDAFGVETRWLKTPAAVEAYLQRKYGAVTVPVYLLDHSGMRIRAQRPFGDRFDSGQVGVAFMTREEILQEYQKEPSEIRDTIRERLAANIGALDTYLTGDVWGYVVTSPGGEVESCWGFYGYETCRDEAVAVTDNWITERSINVETI